MADPTKEAIQEITKLARLNPDVYTLPAGNTPFVIVPSDCKVEDLSKFIDNDRAKAPIRAKGTVKVHDANSFVEYYTLFSDENSRVFADEMSSKILAVLDYHGAREGGPRWGQHRVDFTMRHSPEWETWKGKDGQKCNQMDFAEFVEDNAPDIVNPDAATILEVARELRAKTDVDFASAIRLSNGSVQLKYSETVKGTYGSGNVEVPERFTISIPVYLGCENINVTARLRYRLNSGKLTFWYDLLRAEAIEREAFLKTRSSIQDSLKITVVNGTPA